MSITLIERKLRNSMINIANPIADSAAATVSVKNTKICPAELFKKLEKVTKLKFTANSINSIDINTIIIFLRFKKIPIMDIANKIADNIK
jgi:hypothetical protein